MNHEPVTLTGMGTRLTESQAREVRLHQYRKGVLGSSQRQNNYIGKFDRLELTGIFTILPIFT